MLAMTDAAKSASCPNCGGHELYVTVKPIPAGGGYAPDLLPGLHGWFAGGRMRAVLCAGCGLYRQFANEEALRLLPKSNRWKRL